MKSFPPGALLVLLLVVLWRVLLLIFTMQPIPASDAFGYDGGVINFLHGGGYCNPAIGIVFPIAGHEIYATYPPLYQGMLLVWMKLFGTSVVSAMALHVTLFGVSGALTVGMLRRFFPGDIGYGAAVALLFGLTFDDRPESLAFIFGLMALWKVSEMLLAAKGGFIGAAILAASLFACLYTSVIVGAYFFGVGLLACLGAGFWRRVRLAWFVPFAVAGALFALITALIAKFEPRWWACFMESAREQSVLTVGFHRPAGADLLKLVRTLPVFLLALAMVPWFISRRKEISMSLAAWPALVVGIAVAGWGLLVICLTLLPANYFAYAIFTQVLLAAGLAALLRALAPRREGWLRVGLWLCVALVSVRALGMSTWGVACAWRNSYASVQTTLREELRPFVESNQPILVSSPFLYDAAALGVKYPVHSDWYFDHAQWTNNAQLSALERLRPTKMVLSQFDYYRNFEALLGQIREHPDLVEVRIQNLARLRSPDSMASLQRVLQHISWAPVIVDLDWKGMQREPASPGISGGK